MATSLAQSTSRSRQQAFLPCLRPQPLQRLAWQPGSRWWAFFAHSVVWLSWRKWSQFKASPNPSSSSTTNRARGRTRCSILCHNVCMLHALAHRQVHPMCHPMFLLCVILVQRALKFKFSLGYNCSWVAQESFSNLEVKLLVLASKFNQNNTMFPTSCYANLLRFCKPMWIQCSYSSSKVQLTEDLENSNTSEIWNTIWIWCSYYSSKVLRIKAIPLSKFTETSHCYRRFVLQIEWLVRQRYSINTTVLKEITTTKKAISCMSYFETYHKIAKVRI